MNYYGIVQLINGILFILMGLFVYFHDRENQLNKIFTLFCIFVSIWSICFFMWAISTTYEKSIFWTRALNVGALFIPATYLHHILLFLRENKTKKLILVKLGYALCFLLLSISYTPLYIRSVTQKLNFPFWPVPGPFYHLYCWLLEVRIG